MIGWRNIPGFPDYEVSNTGLVRSHKRNAPRILKSAKHPSGYRRVLLRRNSKSYSLSIGCLVLLTFQGPCPEGCEMCHNDGNPTNDHLDNLRWDTHAANMLDMAQHNILKRAILEVPKETEPEILISKIQAMQERLGMTQTEFAKYLGTQIKVMRAVRGLKQWELAEKVNVCQPTLCNFENGKTLPCEDTLQRIKAALHWPSDEDQVEVAFSVLMGAGDGEEPGSV